MLLFLIISVSVFTVTTAFAKPDEYGFNYKANTFSGWYPNIERSASGLPPVDFWDMYVKMKWNDAFLDENLERHVGSTTCYFNSGAWLTNRVTGTNEDGSKWTYTMKIVAVSPAEGDYFNPTDWSWYDAKGHKIGLRVWHYFAITKETRSANLDPTWGRAWLMREPLAPHYPPY